jgi:hypothetical protein
LLTKIEGTAVVFFAEMMVRGERAKLAERFRQVYQLTAGIAIVALACVVTLNKPFVSVWAGPSLAWSTWVWNRFSSHPLLASLLDNGWCVFCVRIVGNLYKLHRHFLIVSCGKLGASQAVL